MAACDGADRLQVEQCSLTARMSLVIPGQNTIDRTRDSVDVRYSLVCGMKDSKDLVTERRGYDNTVTVQNDPVCYVERLTICPACGDIIVRGTAIIWEALLNSVQV